MAGGEYAACALVVATDTFFNTRRAEFVALAARHAVPAIYDTRDFAAAGGLISYGPSPIAAFTARTTPSSSPTIPTRRRRPPCRSWAIPRASCVSA